MVMKTSTIAYRIVCKKSIPGATNTRDGYKGSRLGRLHCPPIIAEIGGKINGTAEKADL